MSIELLKKITGEDDPQLLAVLEARAESIILSETNRTCMTPILEGLALEVALELNNRLGNEGEYSRKEGGIEVVYGADSISSGLLKRIRAYRLARVSGRVFEAE